MNFAITTFIKNRGKYMQISVVTIVDPNSNYGNRLQNYAVQEVIKTFGADVHTICFEGNYISQIQWIKYLIQKITAYRLPGNNIYWKCIIPRQIKFSRFNIKYINITKVKKLNDIVNDSADYYIVGSDQVWNPQWYDENTLKQYIYLLTFTSAEKKVCFSPSFGTSKLPDKWIPWFKRYLSDFPMISVREEAGARIVRELTGKTAEVLIDPTMMLDVSDWLKIAKKPKKVNFIKPYILTYFLGGRSDRVNRDLQKYAEENNLKIYNLLDFEQPDIYVSGPSEFIYLIANANLVMTDSFHACVFSFLFKKPFLVYQRNGKENNMMSRMYTLLKKFRLERKYVDSGLSNDIFECNYEAGYQQLEQERKKVLTFLKKSMNIR